MPLTPTLAGLDIVEILLYAFFAFFFGLILYLRREDRREGYPLEEDTTGRLEVASGFLWFAQPKTFILPHGAGTVSRPDGVRDTRPLALKRTAVWPGAPSTPTGNPLVDGVGPASYAQRRDVPDLMVHGDPKIQPLRVASGFSIVKGDAALVGYTVRGVDGRVAGTVADVWVDKAESLIRYLEITLADGSRNVLAPMFMASVSKSRQTVTIDAVTAAQFADAPAIASPDQITLYEEERVAGYFGGGYLYATPQRSEPLV